MNAVHGGDVEAVAAWSGRGVDEMLDFSANVNPLGPPDGVLRILREAAEEPSRLMRYPDPSHRRLRTALANKLHIERENIAVGNGSAALIDAVIRSLRPRRCLLPVPAFSEYRKALEQNGVEVVPLHLDPAARFRLEPRVLEYAAAQGRCELCILCNPHNPSATYLSRAEVFQLLDLLRSRGCTLLVDEAFIDYVPDASISDLKASRAIVLRSLTKFYAIPAFRVGYAIAEPRMAQVIMSVLPSWPVGTIAEAAAEAAVMDDVYDRRALAANAEAREALAGGLRALGLHVFDSATNFVLADVGGIEQSADRLRERLIREFGIIVRSCSDYDVLGNGAYIRVAVKAPEDNGRLLDALAELYSGALAKG
jgi:threonine-phosphate decarboxylase